MRKFLLLLAMLSPVLLTTGCVPKVKPPTTALAPGAYNQLDQQLYGSLMAAQGTLNSLKKTIQDPQTTQQVKTILSPYVNQAIADYDVAEVAWQVYHAALSTDPKASASAAKTAINKVQTDLAQTPVVR